MIKPGEIYFKMKEQNFEKIWRNPLCYWRKVHSECGNYWLKLLDRIRHMQEKSTLQQYSIH
jgi:hypothetical protein